MLARRVASWDSSSYLDYRRGRKYYSKSRHIIENKDERPNPCAFSDSNRPQYAASNAELDLVSDDWRSASRSPITYRYVVPQYYSLPEHRTAVYHDSPAMVDDEPTPDFRAPREFEVEKPLDYSLIEETDGH